MAKTKASRAVKLFGTEEPVGKQRVLTSGDVSAVLDNGGLRYIRYHGVEVLRAIAFLVRDKDWGTYGAAISNLKVKQSKSGFTVRYHAMCKDADQEIHYDANIEARDGKVVFTATGLPTTNFLTNRTGFVILHPLDRIVGKPVAVVHTDGKKEKRAFPKVISPGQPIFEIRSLKHTVMPGVTATVLMEGNKFEMEDHRNWMDASYKTYVCSLLDPWPYTLAKGKRFEQSVTLALDGKPKQIKRASKDAAVEISLGKAKGKMPNIGAGVPMSEANAALTNAELIGSLKLSSLVCQIDGRESGQAEAVRAFAELSKRIAVPVKLEIVLPAKEPAEREVAAIAQGVREGGLKPASIVVTQMHDLKSFQPNTPRPWGPSYEEMAKAVRTSFPGLPVGGGMLSYFTELNRKPVPPGLFDFVTHTVCPIVHAADDISVMETLEALPWIFASAHAMIGKAPYHIGPSGIPCRDNPYGAAVASNPGNGRVCLSDRDPRQRGLFAAAWNVGLVAAAAQNKVDAIALGSVTGAQGAIHQHGIHPVYHILRGLGPASGVKHIDTSNTACTKIVALAHQSKSGPVLWLANLTADKQMVKVKGFSGGAIFCLLDEKGFNALTNDADYMLQKGTQLKKLSGVELAAYAVVRIVAS
jgi:D-apionolactonase